jgi:hypothetical protein
MIRTIPEIREWTAGVLASTLYYSTCAYQGRDSANFDALPPAERYPWIVQARAILEAQQ